MAAAAWWRWAAQQQLGGSSGNGGSADASAAALPPCAVTVGMKTQVATVVAGAQITINNQLKLGEATARKTMTTTAKTMTMKMKGNTAAAVAAWRQWAA